MTPLRIKCHCVTDQGWKWKFDSFIRSYSISKYQEKENYAVIMHPHFSEFNHNPWTLSHVTVDDSTALQQNWGKV